MIKPVRRDLINKGGVDPAKKQLNILQEHHILKTILKIFIVQIYAYTHSVQLELRQEAPSQKQEQDQSL